ncbi:hexose phosphate transporter [Mesomycoplasma ovipneumoniae]|uniref:hexose phosphate transporter n=1 Tax=Mesomycoplasma ovipneumoniae TaxID=29562 RepID=UPI002964935E|nr:hexose phosphate transporter [Mesomycoplasma ovipneumoniae]MDW2834400.1 MFS transporter [Mesomycoplasma ovipneumoniae]
MNDNFILKFAQKNIKEKKLTFSAGLILWALIVFAYMIFVINWGFASAGLNGKAGESGYLGHFFPDASAAPGTVVNQAVNWGITIGRGIGSILVGWFIVKISHKYTVVLSLIFMLFGIAAPYSPTYAGFIILRTIFAIGGTMQIVLIQPVVSNYLNSRQKAVISQFSPFFYPIGTIITLIPFIMSGEIQSSVRSHWQTIFLVIGLLTLIPLIGYIILGTKFDLYPSALANQTKQEKLTLLSFFKQKDTWYWAIVYGSWLIAVVFPFTFSKPIFARLVGDAAGNTFNQKISVFLIVFLSGMFVGPFTIGLLSKYQLQRRKYITTVISLGVLFYVLATVVFVTKVGKDPLSAKTYKDGWTWLFLIFGLLMGICLWGIQGVMLNLPHEYPGANPKRVGFQFGLIWGLGYTAFTLATIITSLVNTPPGVDVKAANTGNVDGYALGAYILIIIFSLASAIGLALLKEPHPSYKKLLRIRKLSDIKRIQL